MSPDTDKAAGRREWSFWVPPLWNGVHLPGCMTVARCECDKLEPAIILPLVAEVPDADR
jgi:hypothetical protein